MPRIRFAHTLKAPAYLLLSISVIAAIVFTSSGVWADSLPDRSLQIGDSSVSADNTYTFSFTINTSTPVGSLRILLCSNSPLIDDSCTVPGGLDVTHEHIVGGSGLTTFTVFPAATNELIVDWGTQAFTPPHPISIALEHIVNPNTTGPYYGRLSTYASTDGTGPVVDYGGLAFAISVNLLISSYVPPYLTFCVGLSIPTFDCSSATGSYINLGALSASHSSQGSSQMLLATNAPDGYVIQVYGTTMTSGNNIIPSLSSNAGSRPGNAQFGLNLRANNVPPIGADPVGPGNGQAAAGYDTPNSFRFVSNDVVASSPISDDWRRYTASYLVNVPAGQPPGVYASTVNYVATGSF